MAIRDKAPAWTTWVFAGALLAVFMGERVLGHIEWLRRILSFGGGFVLVGTTVWRALAKKAATGDRRRVETWLLKGQVGCLAALAGYLAATATGVRWLHVESPKVADVLAVLWPILLAASIIPLVLAQWALGSDESGEVTERVETYRVGEAASGGLTVALAAAALFLFGYVASELDKKVDVSYFKTSGPGTATQNMVASLKEPLKVLLFFPDVNDVKEEVRGYLEELRAKTGRVEIEVYDRLVDAKLARDNKVTRDGTIVLVRGTQSESFTIDTEIEQARARLRILDENFQRTFMKVARAERIAYLTIGHGELNDPTAEKLAADGPGSAAALKDFLGRLNYKVKDLGVAQGLSQDVPSDATVVLVLGPKKSFLDEELAALDRYLARGGSVLFAMDPVGEAKLGVLEARLGVRFNPAPLADDKVFYPFRHNAGDHRWIVATQFSSHASLTQLSRIRAGTGVLLVNSGSLADAPVAPGPTSPKRTYVVKSMASTFADKNDDNEFSADEKRSTFNLVAAVEASVLGDGSDKDARRGMRAVVLADADLLGDFVLAGSQLNRVLVADVVSWLGGEEELSGDTASENDVAVEHTRNKDLALFYSTIFGAPLLVLGGGLTAALRRRRRPERRA